MLEIDFSRFPVLETARLILRRADSNDVNELFELRSNPEIMKFIPRPLASTHEEISDFIKLTDEKIHNKEMINWAISLKDNPKMIGTIGYYYIKNEHYRAEIGYMLLPAYQGRGYITEAITEVVNYGFSQMKLHSIEAVIDPDNVASAKALENCHFIKEGHLKESEFYNGQFIDTVIYSRLA